MSEKCQKTEAQAQQLNDTDDSVNGKPHARSTSTRYACLLRWSPGCPFMFVNRRTRTHRGRGALTDADTHDTFAELALGSTAPALALPEGIHRATVFPRGRFISPAISQRMNINFLHAPKRTSTLAAGSSYRSQRLGSSRVSVVLALTL